MSLGVAVIRERREWLAAPVSDLVDHGECCKLARRWLGAMARSHDFTSTDAVSLTGPRWLAARYKWGPTKWPLAWCDAVKAETIDCGVFAALAREIFRVKGQVVYGGQVMRLQVAESTAHWQAKWDAVPGAFQWLGDGVVYHEVVIVRTGQDTARIYDPTDGLWLDPALTYGHSSHVAVRSAAPVALRWGDHMLAAGQWTELRHG